MAEPRNLYLTGFMGVGKTRVGTAVAAQLGRPFVDLDQAIETEAGRSVADIFAEDGERAFRTIEAEVCRALSAQQGLVIATGGGTMVDAANLRRAQESGTVVCLSCTEDELLRRLDGGHDRPLLDPNDLRRSAMVLMKQRAEAYASLPWHVDTAGRSIEEVAEEVVRIAEARRLQAPHGDTAYPIWIGRGLLGHLGDVLRHAGLGAAKHVAVISNPVVDPLYGATVCESLHEAGFEVSQHLIPDGEPHKTLDTVRTIYEELVREGLDRKGTLVSLGGGVTGDIVGFAAATYLRGIRLVQVPTTLLAMIDASIGGKTGVNLSAGKNLVGAFKRPALVLIDPSALASLPAEEIRSGIAEMIKHAILGGSSVFEQLERTSLDSAWWDTGDAVERVARSLGVKIDVVSQDPLETGRRALLNLGHTVGHALELLSGFELRHGDAVAIGLVAAARIAALRGIAPSSLPERIEAVLHRNGLPIECPPYRVGDIEAGMAPDKKRESGVLRWILPRGIGNVVVVEDVPEWIVREALCGMGARSA